MRLARLRAASQLLHRPAAARDPAEIARSIGGAQAQEKRAGLLQFRSRSRRLTAAAVERARVEDRSIVRGWLMRGTVHLVPSDDYRWMLSLFADSISRNARRRLGQLGLAAPAHERALELIERVLGTEGALSRNAIAERLARGGIALTPPTRGHLIGLAVAEGIACIGPDSGGTGSLVLAEDWLGRGEWIGTAKALGRESALGRGRAPDRDRALAELARRYLGAFAPATERDFAKWSGLPLRDCRRGLERIAPELVNFDAGCDPVSVGRTVSPSGRGEGLLGLRGTVLRAPRSPLVRLLPPFDTYLMGYAERSHAVDGDGERRVLPGGGVLRPTICVDGRFVGLWGSKRSGERLTVELEPFEPLDDARLGAIRDEVADLGRFEGLTATLVGA